MLKRSALALLVVLAASACGGSSGSTPGPLTKNAALPSKTTQPPNPKTTTSAPPPVRTPPTTTPPTRNTVRETTTTRATTPPTFPVPDSCPAQGPCSVGKTGPSGGIVFYVAPTPQKWGTYMEVRTEAFEQIKHDTCNLDAYDTYANGRIGDGITQTLAVIAACDKDRKPSASGSYGRVYTYSQKGYRNWFIPSKDELQALVNSKVITFATDKDLTSGTWATKPADPGSRGFDVLYGVKKESLAATTKPRGGVKVEIMSDGSQSYGNPNNRWGWIYIMRAFGPTS